MTRHPATIAGVLLTLFAIAGTGLVSVTHHITVERIAENERQALLRNLNALVPANRLDNDMVNDSIWVRDADLLGQPPTRIFRARLKGRPAAAVFAPTLPDGYSGPMKLLVAVNADGTLAGVRVITHNETPGLGDKVEEKKSDWIFGFAGKSLDNPSIDKWKVKRDGGVFDQFTGATITPRAVVKAVKNTLVYFKRERDTIFQRPAEQPPEENPR